MNAAAEDDTTALASALASSSVACLDLHRVSYTVEILQRKQKVEQTVLHDVSFSIGANDSGGGSMLSILGRSGAGKSTLLNVVSQRGTGKRKGHVLLDGTSLVRSDRLRVGYVEQGDELPPFLTPREHLLFYAALSGQVISAAERKERVDLILRVLELSRVAESRIGVLGTGRRRGLSGGERKRLAIGSALLFNPPVMCLDEYTSGLDSETAVVVTRVLRRVATLAKKLIVATIHQPSSAVYFAFDQVRSPHHSPPSHAFAHPLPSLLCLRPGAAALSWACAVRRTARGCCRPLCRARTAGRQPLHVPTILQPSRLSDLAHGCTTPARLTWARWGRPIRRRRGGRARSRCAHCGRVGMRHHGRHAHLH